MRILKAADHRRMPWKNGGGETVELGVFPAGASVDDFDWRVSMATVATDGPFSTFDGVDRTLVVLSGHGVELSVEEHPAVVLDAAALPHGFPADAATDARLIDGPITDLNVMTRRGRFEHHVERLPLPYVGRRVEALCLLFCRVGPVVLETEAGRFDLDTLDCAMIPAESTILSVSGNGAAVMIELRQV
ncbi:HutD family protein [Rhizobium sp. 0TCS1.26]|uniref:HutD/Ves family protein n=1 Tax=Rhizobium sp. 0TCS1.26 TaxID=3142623 RepID=UPI003D2CA65C